MKQETSANLVGLWLLILVCYILYLSFGWCFNIYNVWIIIMIPVLLIVWCVIWFLSDMKNSPP